MSGRPMLPPRMTGWTGSAARIAAVSDEVVVLPFVPVTPTVGTGTQAQEQVRLGHERRDRPVAAGARVDQRAQRGPQPGLGGREVGRDRRRGRDQRRVRPRSSPGRHPDRASAAPGGRRARRSPRRARRPGGRRRRSRERRRRRRSVPARSRCGRGPRTVTGRSRSAPARTSASVRPSRSSAAGVVIVVTTVGGSRRGRGSRRAARRGSRRSRSGS